MAILGFQRTLVLLDFGSRFFDHLHVDNVIATVDAIRPVTADEHAHILGNALP